MYVYTIVNRGSSALKAYEQMYKCIFTFRRWENAQCSSQVHTHKHISIYLYIYVCIYTLYLLVDRLKNRVTSSYIPSSRLLYVWINFASRKFIFDSRHIPPQFLATIYHFFSASTYEYIFVNTDSKYPQAYKEKKNDK